VVGVCARRSSALADAQARWTRRDQQGDLRGQRGGLARLPARVSGRRRYPAAASAFCARRGTGRTPENATPLPIATYSYGTATSSGTLQYQRSSDAAAPGFQQPFTLNENQPIPVFGVPFSTYVGLLDMTGDGLPDMITSDFIDRPLTIIADWLHSASGQNLLDSVLMHGPFEVHSLTQTRYKQPPSADLVWRQAIDVNGDGRLDIVDAAEQVGHWVVYLNVPDLTRPSTARWIKRSYSTQALEGFLTARGYTSIRAAFRSRVGGPLKQPSPRTAGAGSRGTSNGPSGRAGRPGARARSRNGSSVTSTEMAIPTW